MLLSRVFPLPIVPFVMATLCAAQIPAPPPAAETPAAPTITVPAGTVVPLTLITPIHSRTTKPGNTVRATVAFPIVVGGRTAIPAGSYVEGSIVSLTARAASGHLPAVQIHFGRLLFASGYAVSLDAAGSQALVTVPVTGPRALGQLAWEADPLPLPDPQSVPQQPTLPPLPSNGPPAAAVAGAAIGGAAALTIVTLAIAHRRSKTDFILFDNGWQFQMVLVAPLTLDPARATAPAAPAPNASGSSLGTMIDPSSAH